MVWGEKSDLNKTTTTTTNNEKQKPLEELRLYKAILNDKPSLVDDCPKNVVN